MSNKLVYINKKLINCQLFYNPPLFQKCICVTQNRKDPENRLNIHTMTRFSLYGALIGTREKINVSSAH